ncbi:hypothetical protein ACF0H5_014100 [Mactra antiquata]
MFSNHITARDLLNESQSQSTQDRMLHSDFSQLQNAQLTQYELSMTNSQECFSQEQGSSGNVWVQNSKRPTVAGKYIGKQSKPSLFRSNSQNRITTSSQQGSVNSQPLDRKSSNYLDTMNFMKAKTKERDERDMLSSIVSIVQECTAEVKNSVNFIKSSGQDQNEILKDNFTSMVQSLDESCNKILSAVKQREDHTNQLSTLHKELKQKDDQINKLLQQRLDTNDDSLTTMVESLKSFLTDQHTKTEQRLQTVLETTQKQFQQIKEFESKSKNGLDENNRHVSELKFSNLTHMQNVEKRLINELEILRNAYDHQKREMENFLSSQINLNLQKHIKDIERNIEIGLTNSLEMTVGRQEDYFQSKHMELENICKSHYKALERFMKSNPSDLTNEQLKQSQDFHRDVNQKLKLVLSNLNECKGQNTECFNELKKVLDIERKQPWQNNSVPKVIQDRLDELHTQHQSEIKRLRDEIERNRRQDNKENNNDELNLKKDSIFQNVYNAKSDDDIFNRNDGIRTRSQASGTIFKKNSTFLSPKPPQPSPWNKRPLFGRTDPSPVATVRPQRHHANTITEKVAVKAVQAIQPITSTFSQQLSNYNTIQSRNFVSNDNFLTNSGRFASDTLQSKRKAHEETEPVSYSKTTEKEGGRGRKRGRKRKSSVKKTKQNSKHMAIENSYISNNGQNKTFLPAFVPKANTVTRRNERAVIPASRGYADTFDFHDDTSPILPLRKSHHSTYQRKQISFADEPSVCYSSSEESEASVWSLSEIVGRKVEEYNVPDKDCKHKSNKSDFLSSPSLFEITSETNNQICDLNSFNNVVQEPPSQLCKKKKRKLYSFDMTMMQVVKQSKARKY